MRRWIWRISLTLSCVLLLASGGMWVRSLYVTDLAFGVPSKGPGGSAMSMVAIGSQPHELLLLKASDGVTTPAYLQLHMLEWEYPDRADKGWYVRAEIAQLIETMGGWNSEPWLGLSYGHFSTDMPVAGSLLPLADMSYLAIPYWMPTLIFLVLPLLAILQRTRRPAYRRKRGLCEKCGYDLRGSCDTCPECGHQVFALAGHQAAASTSG